MTAGRRFIYGLALSSVLGLGVAAGSSLAASSGGPAPGAIQLAQDVTSGDPEAGEKVVKKCLACHVLEPGKKKVGPSLYGVVGRTPGTLEGFKYSKAMVAFGAAGAVWDEVLIDEFLTGPKKLVKGTRMSFPGLKKPEDRANVIAYLKQIVAEN